MIPREFDRANPAQYINLSLKGKESYRPLNFREKYGARPPAAPFKNDRFDTIDLINRVQSRKMTNNTRLGFFPNEVFPELGRFNRGDYDFQSGESATKSKPYAQRGYNPRFMELYDYSPVVPPGKKVSNPMPTAENPDPKGFLAKMGEGKFNSLLNGPPATEDQAISKEKELNKLAKGGDKGAAKPGDKDISKK